MVIWFNSDKARRQLLNTGVVITFRVNKRKLVNIQNAFYYDNRFINNRVKFAIVRVTLLKVCVDPIEDYLEEYICSSGFENIKDWIKEICIFMPDRRKPLSGYLYKVELIKKLKRGILK